MDISDQLSSGFIKVATLAGGTMRTVIASARMGSFEKTELEFQDGNKLSLNATNLRTLAQAFGTETDEWIGREIELYVGETMFQGRKQDSVLVRIPASRRPSLQSRAQSTRQGEMDDDIPF